jgi:hypothetical protein
MCAEVNTVLRAVAADSFFNCWYLEILLELYFCGELARTVHNIDRMKINYEKRLCEKMIRHRDGKSATATNNGP